MTKPRNKVVYVEAYRPIPNNPIVCAEVSDVNWTVERKELGGSVGYFSAALWPCWYRLVGSTVTVVFVSNKSFTRDEAIKIAADIIAGKWRDYRIDLSCI